MNYLLNAYASEWVSVILPGGCHEASTQIPLLPPPPAVCCTADAPPSCCLTAGPRLRCYHRLHRRARRCSRCLAIASADAGAVAGARLALVPAPESAPVAAAGAAKRVGNRLATFVALSRLKSNQKHPPEAILLASGRPAGRGP